MPLELRELKEMYDKAFTNGEQNREDASADMVFYYLTQWDSAYLDESTLGYKGEFNILKKAGREISSDVNENPIQIDFVAKGETSEDTAEMLDGVYRTEDNKNSTLEAYEIAENEAIVCGFGAWEIDTEYETIRGGNKNQVVKRKPIFEANNTVFFDPDSKRMDKADANWVFKLVAYTNEGYKELVHELTGKEKEEITPESFKQPEQSYSFHWVEGDLEKIYVGICYHRKKVKEKILTMIDPFGQTQMLKEKDLVDVMDELLDTGYDIVDEKEEWFWEVTKYIMSGAEVLDASIIPGEHLRIVPYYGEYAYIDGQLHYEGVTRLAKDPSRLRNFAMSYLGDILSRSPRPKPIFWKEQIAGYENMYEENGADNNYPYLLQHRVAEDGTDLPLGAIGMMPEQTVPQSLMLVLGETRTAVEDVANTGMVNDVADVDLSGKAVNALNARIDKQSFVYQTHKKHAKRRDAEIFVSILKETHDTPRTVTLTAPDGTKKEAQIMQSVIDKESGELVTLHDISNSDFEIFSKIGIRYSSQKEQAQEQLLSMYSAMQPGDPLQKAVELKLITMIDGDDFDDLKEYARKQLVLLGFKEPETPEEEQLLAEAQQQEEPPSAEMVLALAEQGKAQAAQQKNQIEVMKIQSDARNEEMKRIIEEFRAATDRAAVQVDAQEAGANIDYKRVDTMGKELDNAVKAQQLQLPDLTGLTDDELFRQLEA